MNPLLPFEPLTVAGCDMTLRAFVDYRRGLRGGRTTRRLHAQEVDDVIAHLLDLRLRYAEEETARGIDLEAVAA